MSVTVRKEHVKKFERCLVVGSWKIITTMTLNPVTGNYRVSDLMYKIAFLYNTAVAPSEVVNDSKFLSFAKFDAILAGSLNTNILVDVIGQVVDCGEVKDLITNNKSNNQSLTKEMEEEANLLREMQAKGIKEIGATQVVEFLGKITTDIFELFSKENRLSCCVETLRLVVISTILNFGSM